MIFDLDLLIKALTFLISVGAMVVAVIRTRKTQVDDRFKQGSDRMDSLDRRLSALDQTVASLPGRDELHRVQLNLTEVRGQLDSIERSMSANRETMSSLAVGMQRIENYLLNRKD